MRAPSPWPSLRTRPSQQMLQGWPALQESVLRNREEVRGGAALELWSTVLQCESIEKLGSGAGARAHHISAQVTGEPRGVMESRHGRVYCH